MLAKITPIVLTYNEAPNIRRTLGALRWAQDIVVVDSFSDDATLTLVSKFPQVRLFQRHFDTHQSQWSYALTETGIISEWVLALDADYFLTPGSVEELKGLQTTSSVNGYQAKFVYCVYGKPLRGSAYPPVTVLYRRNKATYIQDGHTQRVMVEGEIRTLHVPILHDDRKSLTQWLKGQDRYMRLETDYLESTLHNFTLTDRIRQSRCVFPFFMFFYCLLIKGAIRDGWAGVYYAFQRMLAEILLALYLIEEDLREPRGQRSEVSGTDVSDQRSEVGTGGEAR